MPKAEPAQIATTVKGVDTGAATQAKSLGGAWHVVRPGESLWSIARGLRGPGAGGADVGREVSRLWELNADRIGTGDPDLIRVGQRLRLR